MTEKVYRLSEVFPLAAPRAFVGKVIAKRLFGGK